jgi:hypothetical protein
LIVYGGRQWEAERFARALLAEVEAHGHAAELLDPGTRGLRRALARADFVFVGTSARRLGRIPRRVRALIRRLDPAVMGWTPICVFDLPAATTEANGASGTGLPPEPTGDRVRRRLEHRHLNVHHVVVGGELTSRDRLSFDALEGVRTAAGNFLSRAAREVEPLPIALWRIAS